MLRLGTQLNATCQTERYSTCQPPYVDGALVAFISSFILSITAFEGTFRHGFSLPFIIHRDLPVAALPEYATRGNRDRGM
jgi:hypothetical protein